MKIDCDGRLIRVEKEDLDENDCFVCDTNITSIGANAFYPVKYYIKAASLKNVQKISQYAFLNCEALEYISFSKNLKSIDYGAFMGCYRLQEVVLPKELSILAHWTFLDCDSIKKVEFLGDLKRMDNVTQNQACDFLANEVFERCHHIEKFVFHNNILFHKGFKKFERLKEIEIEDEKVAKKFWQDAIYDCPQAFMFLDSKLFYNGPFVKSCVVSMELAFEKQFGSNEILAKRLAQSVFEQKLMQEEQKCFNKPQLPEKEDF